MDKVILPREVAEALEKAKEWNKCGDDFLAWVIPRSQNDEKPFLRTLYEYSGWRGNFLKLIDALRYGYDIEPEPITVTVTAEMQDKLRKVYNDCPFNEKVGFRCALTVLDLKIPGVNA